jgi:lipopolysaccharide export system protein LptC
MTDPTLQSDPERFSGLRGEEAETRINQGYTRFVKFMRWGLPLAALLLTFIVFAWPEFERKTAIMPAPSDMESPDAKSGVNELLNPRYETRDNNQNPINVTAAKAIQSRSNASLVRLETPEAMLKTRKGEDVQVEALQGTYDQNEEKLFLQDNVKITHQSGYVLNAQELRINMKTQEAFSQKNVTISGPDADLQATGLQGNVEAGTLKFTGPAKLIFKKGQKSGLSAQPVIDENAQSNP